MNELGYDPNAEFSWGSESLDKPSKEQTIKIFCEVNFAGFTKTEDISNVKCILNVD